MTIVSALLGRVGKRGGWTCHKLGATGGNIVIKTNAERGEPAAPVADGRDPVVAQAMTEGITLLTGDAQLARYPGPVRKI